MPSQTYSHKPSSSFTKRSRWLRVGAFALVCSFGSLLLWNDASTADAIQENRGVNQVTGSSVEPAQYVPGEVIVKFLDSASKATIAAAGGQTIKSMAGAEERLQRLRLEKGESSGGMRWRDIAIVPPLNMPNQTIFITQPLFLTTLSSSRFGVFTIPGRTVAQQMLISMRRKPGILRPAAPM